MTNPLAPTPKKSVLPMTSELPACATPPDVVLGRHVVHVTLNLPFFEPIDLEWKVDRDSLRVTARPPFKNLDLTIPLPAPTTPGQYLIRVNHGVYDVQVQRRRTHV